MFSEFPASGPNARAPARNEPKLLSPGHIGKSLLALDLRAPVRRRFPHVPTRTKPTKPNTAPPTSNPQLATSFTSKA
jgi:hypothetical protein